MAARARSTGGNLHPGMRGLPLLGSYLATSRAGWLSFPALGCATKFPRRRQDCPRRFQDGPRRRQVRPRRRQVVPRQSKRPLRRPKMLPRAPRKLPKTRIYIVFPSENSFNMH